MYRYDCDECGRNRNLELNHIRGRCSASPFNASVLCRECHERVGHSFKEERKYLKKTIEFLAKENYQPTPEDEEFLESCGLLIVDLFK